MAFAATVAMPKATMYQNSRLQLDQDNVRLAGQILPVQPEPVSHPVEDLPDSHFRQSVLRTDPPHDFRAAFLGVEVGHYILLLAAEPS
jgi:hypothetical protein